MAVHPPSLHPVLYLLRRVSAPQRSPHTSQAPSSEQGLSLLECLMAIVVIVLTAAMITPPLFIAAATRVQNRRAEQALQIAQGEVERIQVLMSQGANQPTRLPAVVANVDTAPPPGARFGRLKSVNTTCNTYNDEQIPANLALPIDLDGDCQLDFLLQSFRNAGRVPVSESQPGAAGRVTGFRVGVRVYSFLADNNWANLQRQQATLALTTGQGSQRTRPLSVLYTNLSWGDRSFNLCEVQKTGGRACN